MPKFRSIRRKKRAFYGKRRSDDGGPGSEASPAAVNLGSSEQSTGTAQHDTSASSRKLGNLEASAPNEVSVEEPFEGFRLFDVGILASVFVQFSKCPECGGPLTLMENSEKKKGLSSNFSLECQCSFSFSFYSSKFVCDVKGYEVNTRFVLGMRQIGCGYEDASHFCGVMNMPSPMNLKAYQGQVDTLRLASELESNLSMERAAAELRGENEVTDVNIMIDGTWQKRGHSSLMGVVTAVSPDNGKVIDHEVLSKVCKGCEKMRKKDPNSPDYLTWKAEHICSITYTGSAPSMEPEGATRIFGRSEHYRGLRYTGFIGDGDSKSHPAVVSSKPYGDVDIVKKECVGHVQKRMGTALRKLKKASGKKKLSDGKTIGGKGRLTDAKIDKLQQFYGMAIRRNKGNLDRMKTDIKATLFHMCSNEGKLRHHLCPQGSESWCGWQRDQANKTSLYKHKQNLPTAILEVVYPTYEKLSNESLLSRCLEGFTQNACESFNSLIWKRCPKEVFGGLPSLSLGVNMAVAWYNDGAFSVGKILEHCGIQPGSYFQKTVGKIDSKRVKTSLKRASNAHKKHRQSLRRRKKGAEENAEEEEGVSYAAGEF
jgi:hypothetical protein